MQALGGALSQYLEAFGFFYVCFQVCWIFAVDCGTRDHFDSSSPSFPLISTAKSGKNRLVADFFAFFPKTGVRKAKRRKVRNKKTMQMRRCKHQTRRIEMKKMIVMLMVSAGFAMMAQNSYFYNSNGSPAGRIRR